FQLPMNEVAVVDFTGGRPSAREMNTLPEDGNQLLVLRNGALREGRLLGFSIDDTVRWRNDRGPVEEIPMRLIQRIYMTPEGARNAYSRSAGAQYQPYAYRAQGQQYGYSQAQPYGYSQGRQPSRY